MQFQNEINFFLLIFLRYFETYYKSQRYIEIRPKNLFTQFVSFR
jgi:hypothetical protein